MCNLETHHTHNALLHGYPQLGILQAKLQANLPVTGNSNWKRAQRVISNHTHFLYSHNFSSTHCAEMGRKRRVMDYLTHFERDRTADIWVSFQVSVTENSDRNPKIHFLRFEHWVFAANSIFFFPSRKLSPAGRKRKDEKREKIELGKYRWCCDDEREENTQVHTKSSEAGRKTLKRQLHWTEHPPTAHLGRKASHLMRLNPHWTRMCKFAGNSFDVAWVQCEHSHQQQQIPFACVCASRPVWIGPDTIRLKTELSTLTLYAFSRSFVSHNRRRTKNPYMLWSHNNAQAKPRPRPLPSFRRLLPGFSSSHKPQLCKFMQRCPQMKAEKHVFISLPPSKFAATTHKYEKDTPCSC